MSWTDPQLQQPLPPAPEAFSGTAGELLDLMAPLLPSPETVARLHRAMVHHVEQDDPLFVLRAVRDLVRRETVRTAGGLRIRAGDNSPPWALHALAVRDMIPEDTDLEAILDSLPCHFHDVPRIQHCNAAGWHLAHLIDVKDGETDWRRWDRRELTRRLVRNLHPCNAFFVPKTDWQRVGADPALHAAVAWHFRQRHRRVWAEFLSLAGGTAPRPRQSALSHPLHIATRTAASPRRASGSRQVLGMHFVCRGDLNVVDHGDGTFDTGVWKVSQAHAATVQRVALHPSKDHRSVRHGRVLDWWTVQHEGAERVVFRVRQEGPPVVWEGGGSGEKGYAWRALGQGL